MPRPRTSIAHRFWSKVDQSGECWMWRGKTGRTGYGRAWVLGKEYAAHRVAWTLAKGFPPCRDQVVCHRCDVRACVRPEHLWLGTQADNLRDMWSKGRGHDGSGALRGEAVYNARLTEQAVVEIRRRVAEGEPMRRVALDLHLDPSHVRQIVHRQSWRHVA